MKQILIIIVLLLGSVSLAFAQESGGNKFKKYWNSLVNGNVDRTYEKKVDMSYAVAPCYTREGGVGIGVGATGLYRLDRRDSTMQPADFSVTGSMAVKGFYGITVKGNNNFKGNRTRLSYLLQFQNKNLDFWGISFDACSLNSISAYKRQFVKWESDYVYKLAKDFHIGVALNLNYTKASDVISPSYLEGQKSSYFFTGIGASMSYDTRDFILNPKEGVYFMVKEVYYPGFVSSHGKDIFATTLIFDYYQRAWKGSVFALDLYGQFNGNDVPWALREELGGGPSRKRGNYG